MAANRDALRAIAARAFTQKHRLNMASGVVYLVSERPIPADETARCTPMSTAFT